MNHERRITPIEDGQEVLQYCVGCRWTGHPTSAYADDTLGNAWERHLDAFESEQAKIHASEAEAR